MLLSQCIDFGKDMQCVLSHVLQKTHLILSSLSHDMCLVFVFNKLCVFYVSTSVDTLLCEHICRYIILRKCVQLNHRNTISISGNVHFIAVGLSCNIIDHQCACHD